MLNTLLQSTIRRASGPSFQPPIFVANEEHRFLVRDQAAELGELAPVFEAQSGSYLGEDDIVRLDDQYGRSQE